MAPIPAVANSNLTITVVGLLDKPLTSGFVQFEGYYLGLPVLNKSGSLCDSTFIKCPVRPGAFNLTLSTYLPPNFPAGDFIVKMTAIDQDQEELWCMSFEIFIPGSEDTMDDGALFDTPEYQAEMKPKYKDLAVDIILSGRSDDFPYLDYISEKTPSSSSVSSSYSPAFPLDEKETFGDNIGYVPAFYSDEQGPVRIALNDDEEPVNELDSNSHPHSAFDFSHDVLPSTATPNMNDAVIVDRMSETRQTADGVWPWGSNSNHNNWEIEWENLDSNTNEIIPFFEDEHGRYVPFSASSPTRAQAEPPMRYSSDLNSPFIEITFDDAPESKDQGETQSEDVMQDYQKAFREAYEVILEHVNKALEQSDASSDDSYGASDLFSSMNSNNPLEGNGYGFAAYKPFPSIGSQYHQQVQDQSEFDHIQPEYLDDQSIIEEAESSEAAEVKESDSKDESEEAEESPRSEATDEKFDNADAVEQEEEETKHAVKDEDQEVEEDQEQRESEEEEEEMPASPTSIKHIVDEVGL